MSVKVRYINGNWCVVIDWHRWRKTRKVTPNTQERALEVADRLGRALETYGIDALEAPDAPPPVKRKVIPTLKEYAALWAAQQESEPIKRSTRESYLYLMKKHVEPEFGSWRLTDITYSDLKAWIYRKLGTHSKNTVRLMVASLRSLMLEALKDGHIDTSPVHDLGRFLRAGEVKEKMDPFTLDELHAVERICGDRFPGYYGFLLLMSRTGMRIGEATAVQWRDIDERSMQIIIRRNIPHHRETSTPKTPSSERRIDMSLELAAELLRLRTERKTELLKAGRKFRAEEWIFRTETGAPIQYNNFVNRIWNRCQDLVQVRRRSPHNLRHTWASQMLAAGADPAYVAQQLGHANVATLLRVYAHFVPGSKRVGAEILDGGGAKNTQMNELLEGDEK
jgi:integrase